MKQLLKEPLLHFLLLGVLIFVGYGVLNSHDKPESGLIVVSQGIIENLRASFTRVWQRPPSSTELDRLIQDYIREEVLVREAIGLGLDHEDTVIRRRLRQKMEFIAYDLTEQPEPNEEDLEEFLALHPNLFQTEPRFTFRQVYLNPDRRRDTLKKDVTVLVADLNRADAKTDFRVVGDTILLRTELVDVQASEVTRQFGQEFTRHLAEVPTGRWYGPVISGYGVHLVRVENRKDGRMPELAEIREQVVSEWTNVQREKSNEQFYQNLLKRYAVTIESPSSVPSTNGENTQVRQ